MPTPPLVFVGTATHDTIALVDRYPDADERVLVDDLVVAGGGPAATAAVTASRLGRRVAFVGSVGEDAVGDAIVAGLRAEGVDTSGISHGGRSATSVVVVTRERATRAILHRPADAIQVSHTGWALIAGAEWLHVDHAGWPLVDRWWRSRADRPRLSVDAGNPVDGMSLDGVDLYVPTVGALRRRYGDRSTEELLGRAVSDGARLVVATDGARGVRVLGASEPLLHVPAFSGEVHSTLGAGDVFHGALLAAVDRGLATRDAVEYASAVAFASCRGLDGRSAIPDHAQAVSIIRSREVAVMPATRRANRRATRVNLVATARPTFAVEPALAHLADAREVLTGLGAELVGPTEVVMTPDDVEAAYEQLDLDADLLLHVCATFSDAGPARELYREARRPIVLWAFREPGRVGDRLWWNSLCGANLIGHALVRDGHDVRLVYGDPDDPATVDALRQAIDGDLPTRPVLPRSDGPRAPSASARDALDRLRGRRIGALGDGPTGFTPSEFDPAQLRALLGLEVVPHPLDAMLGAVRDVPVHLRERERAAATEWQPSVTLLDAAEVDRFAATTVALRQWRDEERLDALAIRCWPEFPTELGVCPCSALSRLADEHVPTQCERDVHGAATMLLLDALGAGPTYLVDTVDVVPADNVVRFWHCGAAATQLASDPDDATQWVHSNRKIGVAGNFALRPGRVVASRLSDDPSRPGALRLLIAAGTALDAPNRFQGNTADVRLDTDATEFVTALVTGGFPHHTVLAWVDVRPELRAVADELGIEVVELR